MGLPSQETDTSLRHPWSVLPPLECVRDGVSGRPTADTGIKQGHGKCEIIPLKRGENQTGGAKPLVEAITVHSLGPEVASGRASPPTPRSLADAPVPPCASTTPLSITCPHGQHTTILRRKKEGQGEGMWKGPGMCLREPARKKEGRRGKEH